MPDETTRAIDQLFDFVDKGVDAADRVLNRHKQTEQKLQEAGRNSRRRAVIDTDASVKPKAKEPSPATAVVVAKPHFYIVESADPKSGNTIFVVTDGGNARTECVTREFAVQILRALEKAP